MALCLSSVTFLPTVRGVQVFLVTRGTLHIIISESQKKKMKEGRKRGREKEKERKEKKAEQPPKLSKVSQSPW